jgi:uncharacterized repeat protein (TIGR04138 family)
VSTSTGIPLEGLSFMYEASTFTQRCNPDKSLIKKGLQHFTAATYCESFVRLAQERLGADCIAALKSWNLDTSEKLGCAFYALISRGLMGQQASDLQSDFDGRFNFSNGTESSPERVYPYPLTYLNDYRGLRHARIRAVISTIASLLIVVAIYMDAKQSTPITLIFLATSIIICILSTLKYPIQFSLRTLLIVTTTVAVLAGLFSILKR